MVRMEFDENKLVPVLSVVSHGLPKHSLLSCDQEAIVLTGLAALYDSEAHSVAGKPGDT